MKIFILGTLLSLVFQCNAQRSFFFSYNSTQPGVLIATTGDTPTIIGSDVVLGGMPSAEGGMAPYAYLWIPAINLDDPQSPNPVFTGISSATYALVITDSRGCTASDTIQIIITGVDENSRPSELKVFPNPGHGSIQIAKPESLNLKQTHISLIDSRGRKVLDSPWPNVQLDANIDISMLASGNYRLVLHDGTNKMTSMIIIN